MGWLVMLAAWGAAAALAVPLLRRRPSGAGSPRHGPRRRPVALARHSRPAALLAGAALAASSGPVVGAVAAAALWWLLPALVSRLETRGEAQRREQLAAQLPVVAGLLSSCLAAGAPLRAALSATAGATTGPARELLGDAARTAALGGSERELAAVLGRAGEPGWQSLGAAVVRSSATGAPLAELLLVQSDAALRNWAAAAAVRARGAAVRTVLPLALCYLPGFLVLGVAPVVAGFLGEVELP